MYFFTGTVVGVSICGFRDVLMGVLMDVCTVVLQGFFAFMRLPSGTNDWARVSLGFVAETLVDSLSGLPLFQHHPHLIHQYVDSNCFDPFISSCVIKVLKELGFAGLKSACEPYRAQSFYINLLTLRIKTFSPP